MISMAFLYLLEFILSIWLFIDSCIQGLFIQCLYVPDIIPDTEGTKTGVMVPGLLEFIV